MSTAVAIKKAVVSKRANPACLAYDPVRVGPSRGSSRETSSLPVQPGALVGAALHGSVQLTRQVWTAEGRGITFERSPPSNAVGLQL